MQRLLLAVLLLAACRPRAETPEAEMARQAADQKAAETAIAAANDRFVVHYNSGHLDSVVAFFAPDAHVMPPNTPTLVGHAALRTAFERALALKPQLKLVSEAISASGDLAIERGTYEETVTPPGSSTATTDRGKYLTHWHRIGGHWLIVDTMNSSDLPPPGGPPVPPQQGRRPPD